MSKEKKCPKDCEHYSDWNGSKYYGTPDECSDCVRGKKDNYKRKAVKK